jgi:hypothetical protein
MARKPGIQKAIDIAGGIRPLERLSGINKNVIWRMSKAGMAIPKHCQTLHRLTGVPLHELNPEIYPKAA